MRGSFYSNKKILGLAIGLVSLGLSATWISYTGFHVTIYDISVEGEIWVLIGFVIGYFVTKREDVYQKIILEKIIFNQGEIWEGTWKMKIMNQGLRGGKFGDGLD